MKIKNSLSNFNTMPLIFAFIGVSVVSVIIRSIQVLKYIEPETGFYIGNDWLLIVLYVILGLSCFAFCLVSFLSKSTENHQPQGMKSNSVGNMGTLFAVYLFIDGASSFMDTAYTQTQSDFKGLMSSGILTGMLQSAFALFSMIYLFIFAIDFRKGTQNATKFKILALSPVGWTVVRLVHRFIRQISFLEISDLFLELVMLSFSVMFFMALAQVVSGVNSTGFSWRLTGFGLSASLISFTTQIPRLIANLISPEKINEDHPLYLVDLIFAIFVFIFILSLNKKQKDIQM